MKSKTETIIGALRVLARGIQTDDGVVNACLGEAAERMEELSILNAALKKALACATNFIVESPCDPDITVEQCVAYDLYQESIADLADLRSEGANNEPKQ